MTIFKVKDNTTTIKSEFNYISNLTRKIENKTLAQLEKDGCFVFPESLKDAEDIAKEQMVLESVNSTYRTSNIMGFIGYGKERLIIESRFSSTENDYFFQYLLEKVVDFPNVLELNTDANRHDRIFNLLLFLFPRYLKNAMRKGIFKTYISHHYNDFNIKGSVDVARHIRKNIPFTGKIAYKMREFSYDNHLVQLIRHTIEFIKSKPYGHILLGKTKDAADLIIKTTDNYKCANRQKVIIANKKNIIRHAYYHEYAALQRLCIKILQHENHNLGDGLREICGVLFDGAWLFEEYINLLISDVFYHPMNKGGKGAQRLFDNNIGLIYPDFISKNANARIIADAKYKPYSNIGNKDYLQILAYMLRFDAKVGLYFYPEIAKTENNKLMLNMGSTYEKNVTARTDIYAQKCGIYIPDNAINYKDFKAKIAESEQNFKQKLRLLNDDLVNGYDEGELPCH